MRPKGGTFILLLILTCVTLAKPPKDDKKGGKKQGLRSVTQKLMWKCYRKGLPVPDFMELQEFFDNSDVPMLSQNSEKIATILSKIFDFMQSSSAEPRKKGSKPGRMENMWNCSDLPAIIRQIRNSSEAIACYLRALVAPQALRAFHNNSKCNVTSEDFEALLWAVEPILKDKSFNITDLPSNTYPEMIKKMLRETCQEKSNEVIEWVKEYIMKKYFDCTTMPPSEARAEELKQCEPSLPWLTEEALNMIGPSIFKLPPSEVENALQDELCKFLMSGGFKNATTRRGKKKQSNPMPPSLSEVFMKRFKNCFEGRKELAENLDKFGILACQNSNVLNWTSDLKSKLLSDPNICKKLKKQIIRSWSSKGDFKDLHKFSDSLPLFSPRQLTRIPATYLEQAIKNKDLRFKPHQQRAVSERLHSNKRCDMSINELIQQRSIGSKIPFCTRYVEELLKNKEGLKKFSRYMSEKQKMFVMERLLSSDLSTQEEVVELPGSLLCVYPLDKMGDVSIPPEVLEKTQCLSKALCMIEKMKSSKTSIGSSMLLSALPGVPCEVINTIPDSAIQAVAREMTEDPKLLSKKVTGCVAKTLFQALERKRKNYFEEATEEEFEDIPTWLLLYLPPSVVQDLSDSLCPALLDHVEEADLSQSPPRSPSLPAFTERALFCLANGEDLSVLTGKDVLSLGPFLCYLKPDQLRLLARDVLISTLQEMASKCKDIPESNTPDLIKLLLEVYGDPSTWSLETMEKVLALLILDDNATSALPDTPQTKTVLSYLYAERGDLPTAAKDKYFKLTSTPEANRYTRAADTEVSTEEYIEYVEKMAEDPVYLMPKTISQMPNEIFNEYLEKFGTFSGFNEEQLAALIDKTKLSGTHDVSELGCILQGYNITELEKLPLSLDDLNFVANCDWTEAQVAVLWKAVAKNNQLKAEELDATTMVALDRFICGLSTSEIQRLNEDAFKNAVGSMNVSKCSPEVLQQFKIHALSAFGSPETWSEAQVYELHCIVAGLNGKELASLGPSVFSFIEEWCMALISPDDFAELSVEQLEAFTPEAADSATDEQKAALGNRQREALERASTVTFSLTQRTIESGAPSLSVEGIAAVMKPLLFLLMGLLLL